MNTYNIIIFDLDGTIVDSKPGTINSYKYTLSKLNIFENDENKLLNLIGPPIEENFEKYLGSDNNNINIAINIYRDYFINNGINEIRIYDYIIDLLDYLKSKNKKLIIATSRLTKIAIEMVNKLKLNEYFDEIIGSNNKLNSKSKIIKYIIRKNNFNKNNILMIGDSIHDIIGAQNNQIDSLAVSYGYSNFEKLKNMNPNFIVKKINEIYNIL